MNVIILNRDILSLNEYELAKHFMDKIIDLEEKSVSEVMETDIYESKLKDIIMEYKWYLVNLRDRTWINDLKKLNLPQRIFMKNW